MWPIATNTSCFNLHQSSSFLFSMLVSHYLLAVCVLALAVHWFETNWEQLVWLTPNQTIHCVALELMSFWQQCCFCTAAYLWPNSHLHSLFCASIIALFLNLVLSTGAEFFFFCLLQCCHSSTADPAKEFWTCVALNCITYARALGTKCAQDESRARFSLRNVPLSKHINLSSSGFLQCMSPLQIRGSWSSIMNKSSYW